MATDAKKSYLCSCHFSHNIFLYDYKLHVMYYSREQFISDYQQILSSRGCDSGRKLEDAHQQVLTEIQRRQNFEKESVQRQLSIQATYTALYPEVYQLKTEYLHPDFLKLVYYCQSPEACLQGAKDLICSLQAERVYQFPVFTVHYCELLLQELSNFEASDCPKTKPNTMNNYGILLSDLSLDLTLIEPLIDYLNAITNVLFPDCGGGDIDSHKAFTVHYQHPDRDLALSHHYDNSEITLNLCLGHVFEGGELYFGDMKDNPLKDTIETLVIQKKGLALLHRGQHMHEARMITSGDRCNFVLWMRSSSVRNKLCPMCNRKPDLMETHGEGDGFTLCAGMEADDIPTVNMCAVT